MVFRRHTRNRLLQDTNYIQLILLTIFTGKASSSRTIISRSVYAISKVGL